LKYYYHSWKLYHSTTVIILLLSCITKTTLSLKTLNTFLLHPLINSCPLLTLEWTNSEMRCYHNYLWGSMELMIRILRIGMKLSFNIICLLVEHKLLDFQLHKSRYIIYIINCLIGYISWEVKMGEGDKLMLKNCGSVHY